MRIHSAIVRISIVGGALIAVGCGAGDLSGGPDEDNIGEIRTMVQGRGPDGAFAYFIDTEAYRLRGELVQLTRGIDFDVFDGDVVARRQEPVILGTGYGAPTGDTHDLCGPGNGLWVRDCIVPRSKNTLWSYNARWSGDYINAFQSAQAVANATAFNVRGFEGSERPNVIVYESGSRLDRNAYAITITEAERMRGSMNGKRLWRHTTTPQEIWFYPPQIEADVSGSATNKQRMRQHVFCHELGHAMGLPHNPESAGLATCMQATGLTAARGYTTLEKRRLEIFTPGDWDDVTLLTVQ